MDKCLICTKPFPLHSKKIKCCVCLGKYHLNCISLSNENISYIQDNLQTWFCSMCITEIFPFNNIEDEVEFVANIEASTLPKNSMCYLSDKVFIPFELNDKDHSSLLCDPDPDLHYFNSFNQVQANSNYYTETTFKEYVAKCTDAKDMFSMCHLNIRSISKNLSSFENYLETIQTWLNDTNYYVILRTINNEKFLYGWKQISSPWISRKHISWYFLVKTNPTPMYVLI